jgi:hypothetical protein
VKSKEEPDQIWQNLLRKAMAQKGLFADYNTPYMELMNPLEL